MLEITNIQPINKGSVLAACDVHIVPWRMTLHRILVFQKGSARWIGLPSREVKLDDGTTRYDEMMSFDNLGIKERFRDQIMQAIDKYLEENPDMQAPPAIKETDEVPF